MEKITSKTPKLFYQNGHKLAIKYLSEGHSITKKFNDLLINGSGNEKEKNNENFLHFNVNNKEQSNVRVNKGSFIANQNDSSHSDSEENFFTKKKNKAFRVQTKKIFQNESRAKSLSKMREESEVESEVFQQDFSGFKLNKSLNFRKDLPNYKKQMKEIEKTMKEMKKLKEKYERSESSFFLQKNLELLMRQRDLENFISKRNEFHSNIAYPNNSGLFYMPPQNTPFMPMNKNPIDPTMATTTEILFQKQQELENALVALQKENLKIHQEREEKNKEMSKLKEYVAKLEAEKGKFSENSKESKQGKTYNPNELNILPASSFNNLNESNLSETSTKARGKYSNREDRKFNLPFENLKKEERKTPNYEKPNESILQRKKSSSTNETPSSKKNIPLIATETLFKKASNTNIKIKNPQNNIVLTKSNSKTISEEKEAVQIEKSTNKTNNNPHRQSFTSEKPSKQEKQQIVKENINFNENPNKSEIGCKRSESIKKILIEFQRIPFKITKTESLKKQDSLSSMDLALESVNPGHLLRNILSNIPSVVNVRKKVFLENKIFIFEFRIIQENDTHSFKLRILYESNKKNIVKEETLQLSLVRKILQNIDYRDVVPFIFPLKTIAGSGVSKFCRYFTLPFFGIGVGDDSDRKVEIWPKAHGLIDKNLKTIFFGEDFFVFFHFLINDNFRLILSNSEK